MTDKPKWPFTERKPSIFADDPAFTSKRTDSLREAARRVAEEGRRPAFYGISKAADAQVIAFSLAGKKRKKV